jgi:polysaccharide biosynthesis transport protein
MAERQIKLLKYVGIIWHWLWLLLIISALTGGIAFAYGRVQSPIYESVTRLLIEEAPGNRSGNTDYNAVLVSERRAQTYTQMMQADTLLRSVYKSAYKLTAEPTPAQLAAFKSSIDVQVVRSTQLIKLAVRDTDPARAADSANKLAEGFIEQVRALQAVKFAASKDSLGGQIEVLGTQIKEAEGVLTSKSASQADKDQATASLTQFRPSYAGLLQQFESIRIAEAQSNSTIVQLEPATVPDAAVWPRVTQLALLGALVGLLAAIGLVFLIEALDNTIKDPDALAQQVDLPILGFIWHIEGSKGSKKGDGSKRSAPITVEEPRSPVSEAFRILRTNIEFAGAATQLKTLLVTSAFTGDGKSTSVANIAAVVGQGDNDVLVVDADMRRPTQHRRLLGTNSFGLSDLFVQATMPFFEVVQKHRVSNVSLLSAGKTPPNPAELLATERMDTILAEAKAIYDFVIVDAPPVLPVTDAMVLARKVDGVLLVVRAGHTRASAVAQIVEQMRRANVNVIGLVINDVVQERMRGYYYRRSKYYSEGDTAETSKPVVAPAK